MTFDSQLCEDIVGMLGRDHALRHAYRAHLWRHVRGVADHSRSNEVATMRADVCSLIQASIPLSDRPNSSRVARTLLRLWRM
jgi:hypothetical protein